MIEKKSTNFESILEPILQTYSSPLNQAKLLQTKLVYLCHSDNRADILNQIVDTAKKLISLIEVNELAMHYGQRIDSENQEAQKERKKYDQLKEILCSALAIQIGALQDLFNQGNINSSDLKTQIDLLKKWLPDDEPRLIKINANYYRSQENYALALKQINLNIKALQNHKNLKEFLKLKIDISNQLGWNIWSQNLTDNLLANYPQHYPSF